MSAFHDEDRMMNHLTEKLAEKWAWLLIRGKEGTGVTHGQIIMSSMSACGNFIMGNSGKLSY